ncbi:MAG TPA: hypothetical protein VJL29_04790 [Thermoguttaceae bacterium]|nr:hypothetical protein [Thermoguttaceae bacterium]
MKKAILAIAVVAVTIATGAYIVVPQLHLRRLEHSLFAATDAKTAARVTRVILKTNSPRATDVLVRYAREHQRCDFDSLHKIALLCDEINGQIHIVYVGPCGPKVSTGNPAIDKAVEAVIPETTSESLFVGQPPHLFNGIHLLLSQPNQVEFVLRPKGNDPWLRLRFVFNEGGLVASGSHDVNNADLNQWRKTKDWPKSW